MQLNDLLSVIGAPASQGAGQAVAALAGGDAKTAFGKLLDTLMGQAGEGGQDMAAGAKPRGKLALIAEAATGALDKADDPLAGLQAVLAQVLNGQTPTEAARTAAAEAIEGKLGTLGGKGLQRLAERLEKMIARVERMETALTTAEPKTAPQGWPQAEGLAATRQLMTETLAKVRAAANAAATPPVTALPDAAEAVSANSAERIAGRAEEAVEEAPRAADVAAREPATPKPAAPAKPATHDIGVARPSRAEDQADKTFASEVQAGQPKPAAADDAQASGPKPVHAEATAPKPETPLKAAPEPAVPVVEAQARPPAANPAHEAARTLAADAARGSPEAVAHLSAQIVKRLESKSTRFEMELHPADLGRVDVRMRIEQDGRLNAQMSFDNPLSAADFRARGDELRRHLEQAGFQLTDDSLSFTDRESRDGRRDAGQGFGQGSGGNSDTSERGARARAFREADINTRVADAAVRLQTRAAVGLDVRV